jgi:hypothetical protein
VSVGGLLALDQVLLISGQVCLVFGLQKLVEGGAQDKAEIVGSRPLFGTWEYVMGMGCQPMGLPMFRPIL